MNKIYFDERSIIICDKNEASLADPNAIRLELNNKEELPDIVDMFINKSPINKLFITNDNTKETYENFCKLFKLVNAGGGLVQNLRGDYLLIKRNGIWDLPKGHQEEGEKIEDTALREVEEESGINNLRLGEFICRTEHCYLRDNIWHLKHSYWYKMYDSRPEVLTPQKEEDITKAIWLAKSMVDAYLTNSYPSILDVFKQVKSI